MEEYRPLAAIDQKHLFDMTVVCGDALFACKVYTAMLADGTKFTRVVYGEEEGNVIDLDYWKEIGWIDLYYGEPSPWSALVGSSLDFHLKNRLQNN